MKVDLRNRKLVMVIRILLGAFFAFSGVGGLMAGSSLEGVPEPMIPTMQVFLDTGIFHMIKITEVVAGLMLVVGFLPALAAIFLAPICIGVLVFNANVSPEYIGMGIVVTILTAYLGYAYWDKYKMLFQK